MIIRYPDRSAFKYSTLRATALRPDYWINCSCGRKMKVREESPDYICKHCGQKLGEYDLVSIDELNRRHYYNRGTTMFIDDDLLTISFFVVAVSKAARFVPLIHHKGSINLKIRFDKTRRTSVMYTSNPISMDPYELSSFTEWGKFTNTTQPVSMPFSWMDIKLDTQLVEDFCKFMEVEVPKEKVGLIDLAWINRVGSSGEKMRKERDLLIATNRLKKSSGELAGSLISNALRNIPYGYRYENLDLVKEIEAHLSDDHTKVDFQELIDKINKIDNKGDYPLFTNMITRFNKELDKYKEFKKNEGRLKRYLKTNHEIKNFENLIYDPMLEYHKIDTEKLSKRIIDAYKNNPHSMKLHLELSRLFTTESLLIRAIEGLNLFKSNINVYMNHPPERDEILYAFSKKARDMGNVDCLTDRNIYSVEKKIFDLLFQNKDSESFSFSYNKVTDIIYKTHILKKNNIPFRISNDINKAHRDISFKELRLEDPEKTYDNNFPSERIKYGKDIFIIRSIKSSTEWIERDIKMGNQERFHRYDRKSNIGALELSLNNKAIITIGIDHHGHYGDSISTINNRDNSVVTERVLKVIGNYCERHKIDYAFREIFTVMNKKIGKLEISELSK